MPEPLVSVITIFLNEERFLPEAVESVLAQSYPEWELLLCDDGSADGSSAIARDYAARYPDRIRYLEHPSHENRGMSATRNLGLAHARGNLVAFLDADDVWLPRKLEVQVSALAAHPGAGLVYGPSLYWHSWTGRDEDRSLDGKARLAGAPGLILPGKKVLSRILRGRADAICTCSIVARKPQVSKVGAFEEQFTGLFEDQVFLSKFLIEYDVLIVRECTDRYRQHADSCCSRADRSDGTTGAGRAEYLRWLRDYIAGTEVGPGLHLTVARELALQSIPGFHRLRERWRERRRNLTGSAITMFFSVGRRLLPQAVRKRLWRALVQKDGDA